ncbi:L-2-amino-thiazoline-4-carboxylic acid hydrolase [Roseospira navarrensis]|uniref:L-2-amino-thiazoline-4-carboxylic acid hydrolase n=1 Tax=Roseospira navarrensis TaxID=140058 RepID=A0A7X1ZAX1_9PROT|nr:L-2-amino-thiazoline-4-carboxylic acid hydrolase [Roseospira navarrensis]MQX35022.1 hypothetical protein [Roseospira navarrensis]
MSDTPPVTPTVTLDMLKAAFAMRAEAYARMYDVLSEEFGPERAVELIGRATRRMGEQMGERFKGLGPDDLAGLKDAFLGGIPCGEEMFAPEVRRCDDEMLEIKFHRCPLKDVWVANGRSDTDVRDLCRAAGAIDGGLFTTAGFTFLGETWRPGETGCCLLRVAPGGA